MTFIYRIQNVYTFKITYIFIIYNLNTFFFSIFIFLYTVHYLICFFYSYICVILHPYCVIPMYVCTIMHVCIVNKKWSDKDTDCTCCVYCILKCYIVEITRISAFHGYMTCSTFFSSWWSRVASFGTLWLIFFLAWKCCWCSSCMFAIEC